MDSRARGFLPAVVFACAALIAVPSSASATTTFGADLNNRAPDNTTTCGSFGFSTCSWDFINFATGESVFPPAGTGVISRVRVKVGGVTGPMQIVVEEALRFQNPNDPGHPTYACCKAINVSQVFNPPTDRTTPVDVNFPVRQDVSPDPVSGGYVDDHLALSVLAPNVPIPASTDPNSSLTGWFPAWQRGDERAGGYGTSGYVILMNADWDPAGSAPGTGSFAPVGRPGSIALGRLRTLRNGTANLDVTVPGPGLLQLGDAARIARVGSARKRKRRARIKSVRRKVTKAGTVTLKIKPSKAGKRTLRRRRKLKVRVRVSFTPTGAKASSTAERRVTLRLGRRKRR